MHDDHPNKVQNRVIFGEQNAKKSHKLEKLWSEMDLIPSLKLQSPNYWKIGEQKIN